MAGRYDITPLDTSTRRKLLGQYNQLADEKVSPAVSGAIVSWLKETLHVP